MQSPHFVGLIRIGFFTGGAISLAHRGERHPGGPSDQSGSEGSSYGRTNGVNMSLAEEAVWLQTVLYAGRHRHEMPTSGVVATVDDLCQSYTSTLDGEEKTKDQHCDTFFGGGSGSGSKGWVRCVLFEDSMGASLSALVAIYPFSPGARDRACGLHFRDLGAAQDGEARRITPSCEKDVGIQAREGKDWPQNYLLRIRLAFHPDVSLLLLETVFQNIASPAKPFTQFDPIYNTRCPQHSTARQYFRWLVRTSGICKLARNTEQQGNPYQFGSTFPKTCICLDSNEGRTTCGRDFIEYLLA
jgi:hypothetical protein